ncbi:MAG: hypothetical protein AAFQ94_24185 [Bacteroidota bacterium]
MQIDIQYVIDWSTVINDEEINAKSQVSFQNIHNQVSFSNFLDAFADSKIIIWDATDPQNSIFIRGAILSFCFNYFRGLRDLISKEKEEIHAFGTEDGEYCFKSYLVNEKLIIESGGEKYRYKVKSFMGAFEKLIRKVEFELPLYYQGLSDSKYFKEYCVKMRS